MKLLITEQQSRFLIENYDDDFLSLDDYFEYQHEITSEIFSKIKNKEKIRMSKINPSQYKTALTDFVKWGKFVRFPVKYIYRWKGIMVQNVAILDVLTSIHGHSQHFPFEEFYDVFNYTESYESDQLNLFTGEREEITPEGDYSSWAKQKYQETGNKDYTKEYNLNSVYEYLDDVCDIDSYVPFFESGHAVMSDFGLRPLQELAEKLINVEDPNDMIILINKMLDITHPRGDLAELFIVGGSRSLDDVAGFEREKMET